MVSGNDMDERELVTARQRQREFTRRAAAAACKAGGPEPTEEQIVEAVKATRETIYRERYRTTPSPDDSDAS